MTKWILFLVFLSLELLPVRTYQDDAPPTLTVWNVGQGLWVTIEEHGVCTHIDAGGEFLPIKKMIQHCPGPQRFFLSHLDWDHLNGLSSKFLNTGAICIDFLLQKEVSAKKQKLLHRFEKCKNLAPNKQQQLIYGGSPRSSNSHSRVWMWQNRWLLPGDSPTFDEKIWRWNLPLANQIRVLVLGHHGSRTSTSRELLKALPRLRMAIASARQKKYGHPHMETKQRLSQQGVAILRTQDWGHLIFELDKH